MKFSTREKYVTKLVRQKSALERLKKVCVKQFFNFFAIENNRKKFKTWLSRALEFH